MAIEKTVFSAGTINEVGAWLIANATDYFDEVAMNGSTIECSIGEQVVLAISYSGSTSVQTNLSITPVGEETAETRCFKNSATATGNIHTAYKTSKGILLACWQSYSLIICKNADGDTCLVMVTYQYPTSSTSNKPLEVWDIENSSASYKVFDKSSQQPASLLPYDKAYNGSSMSLFPLMTASGKTIPGVYCSIIHPYTSEYLIGGIELQLGASDKYAFTGLLALGE